MWVNKNPLTLLHARGLRFKLQTWLFLAANNLTSQHDLGHRILLKLCAELADVCFATYIATYEFEGSTVDEHPVFLLLNHVSHIFNRLLDVEISHCGVSCLVCDEHGVGVVDVGVDVVHGDFGVDDFVAVVVADDFVVVHTSFFGFGYTNRFFCTKQS